MKYRADIDGLRAIAVLSVVAFHLNHEWLPGGFIGVDIFFVISGYLITSVILQELSTSDFSLATFYQRRIARIFPAFAFVAIVTSIASAFVYSPQDFASAGANLSAAMMSLANMKYMLQGSYFDISPDAQPFLHYWSLSVEEQFYLLFPTIIILLNKARRLSVFSMSIIFIASIMLCISLTYYRPNYAFYLLPTRTWELLAGSLVALVHARSPSQLRTKISSVPSFIFATIILASLLLIENSRHFPGYVALIPVLGTAGILMRTDSSSDTVTRILSSTPLVNIGKLSFSLYLWHWPIFSLIDYQFYQSTSPFRLVLKIAITSVATVITYHALERPARRALARKGSGPAAYSAFILISLTCIVAGIIIRQANYVNSDENQIISGGLYFGHENPSGSVILMGDSNGSMYGKAVREVCQSLACNLNVISISAGDPLPAVDGRLNQQWVDSLQAVRMLRPDVLVLAYAWSAKIYDHPIRLHEAIRDLSTHAKHIIILNQPPTLPLNASRTAIRAGQSISFREEEGLRLRRIEINALLGKLASSNIKILDIASSFESESGEIVFLDPEGRQMYQDSTHISGFGALAVRKKIEPAIAAILQPFK